MTSYISSLLLKYAGNLPFVDQKLYNYNHHEQPKQDLSFQSNERFGTTMATAATAIVDNNNRNQTASLYDAPPPYPTMIRRPSASSFVNRLFSTAHNNNTNAVVDRKCLGKGLQLVEMAVEEYDSGKNEMLALNIYLNGLDKIIMALPNLQEDNKTKETLREKLVSLENRVGIVPRNEKINRINSSNVTAKNLTSTDLLISRISLLSQLVTPSCISKLFETIEEEHRPSDTSSITNTQLLSNDPLNIFKSMGIIFTNILIQGVILVKQSPLPAFFWLLFAYFIQFVSWIDKRFHIISRVQVATVGCIKLLLNADEKYRLHEFASEAIYILVSASLKAFLAYKETPSYANETCHDKNEQNTEKKFKMKNLSRPSDQRFNSNNLSGIENEEDIVIKDSLASRSTKFVHRAS